jgi:hypothetical protein
VRQPKRLGDSLRVDQVFDRNLPSHAS